MQQKINLELVYSTTQIIGCFNKKRILEFYDTLKNRLIKHNRKNLPYEKVEISKLSNVEKENIYLYKEGLSKQEFEDTEEKIKLNNIEGEYLFEYQANYEISIFKEIRKSYVSNDREVEHYWDLMRELHEDKKANAEMHGFDGEIYDQIRERNYPKYPKHIEEKFKKSDRDNRIRLAIWAEQNGKKHEVEMLLLGGPTFNIIKPGQTELNKLSITKKDRDRERNVRKKYKEEQIKKYNKRKEEIKKSWE